eukprot:417016-Prorocentrum_lima.AAC.1
MCIRDRPRANAAECEDCAEDDEDVGGEEEGYCAEHEADMDEVDGCVMQLSLIHISEPTRLDVI